MSAVFEFLSAFDGEMFWRYCRNGDERLMNTFIRQKAEQTDRQAGRQTNKLKNKTNK